MQPHAATISPAGRLWIKSARELKIAERDLAAGLERMKQDLPAPVGQQLVWMRDSGFVEVACTYRT